MGRGNEVAMGPAVRSLVQSFRAAFDGHQCASRRTGGLLKYQASPPEWKRIDTATQITGEIQELAFGAEGRIAAYAGGGLFTRESGATQFQECQTGPCASPFINAATRIAWDRDGNLVFGQNDKLWLRNAQGQWREVGYTQLGTGFEVQVSSLFFDDNGDLYVGSKSLFRLKRGASVWETLHQVNPRSIADIQKTAAGDIVFSVGPYVGIGGANTQLFRLAGSQVLAFGPGSQATISRFVVLPNAQMYGSGSGGVWKRRLDTNEDWSLVNDNLPSSFGEVRLATRLNAEVLLASRWPNSSVDGIDVHARIEGPEPGPAIRSFFPTIGTTVEFTTQVGNEIEKQVLANPASGGAANTFVVLRCHVRDTDFAFVLTESSLVMTNGATATLRPMFRPISAGTKLGELRCREVSPGRVDRWHVWPLRGTTN